MKRVVWALALLLGILVPIGANAQQQGTVQGTVVDATTMQPLAGVQVVIPALDVGTLTNPQGRFQLINVPSGSQLIRATMIGYTAEEQSVAVPAGGSVGANFALESSAVALEGVVVTALGIERQARALGVAAQSISDEALSEIAPNIASSLSGQVSGVNVTSASTPGGSTRIVMRGENSLLGDNQPLFVIDGIPVDNYTGVPNEGLIADQGGLDYGTLINDLDPNSIQSITILKGPNAAALYGSRAANGAVLIETKKGFGALGGAEVTASQTVTWENELRLPNYQNQYGQGYFGAYEFYDGDGGGINDYADESWGPPLDQGLEIPQWNSPVVGVDEDGRAILQPLPWVSHPGNIAEFYEQGRTMVTSASVAASSDRLNGRLGFSRLDQNGIVPGNTLERTTVSFAGGINVAERLGLNTSIQYITHEGNNRPAQGYDSNNPQNQLGIWFGRQVDVNALRATYLERYPEGHPAAGTLKNWQLHYWNNPYYDLLVNTNEDTRDRLIGQVAADYQFTSWLNGLVRTSIDWYDDRRIRTFAEGNTPFDYATDPFTASRYYLQETGAFWNWNLGTQEINNEFLLSAAPELGLPVSTSFNFGGTQRAWERTHDFTWVGKLSTPGVFNVSNAAVTPNLFTRLYEKRVNSLYGQAEFGYNNYAFITVTGRNDWSSTLPEDNNDYFYPSVSGSFVFSDAIPALQENEFLSYGKLRASWARVGNDTDPYRLVNTYLADEIWDGNPTFTVQNSLLKSDLGPEITESIEFGIELAALNDRLGLDLTYYSEETRDQIFNVDVSATTGFTSRWLNAGTVENKGWEVLLRTVPVETDDLRWQSSFTWAKNDNEVVALVEGITGLEISSGDFFGARLFARPGEPYGQIMGRAYQRSPDGRIIVGPTGLPLRTNTNEILGNANPDWRGGWQNQLTYRNFGISTLLDARVGGEMFSGTNLFGRWTGTLEETQGRGRCVTEETPHTHYPICDATTGIIVDGVQRIIENGDTTYVENTTPLYGGDYYFNNYFIPEANIIDASFVKLREVTLSYNLPSSWIDRAGVSGMQVSLIGRNLWLWTPDENPHVDPETLIEATNIQGFEYGQIPTARSIGFTVNVRP